MKTEHTLKDLLTNESEDVRKEARILTNLQYPAHSTWTITLKQVIR
jgi:hypothetical protein